MDIIDPTVVINLQPQFEFFMQKKIFGVWFWFQEVQLKRFSAELTSTIIFFISNF